MPVQELLQPANSSDRIPFTSGTENRKEPDTTGAVDAKTRAKMERRLGLLLEAQKLATEGRGSGLFLFTDLASLLVAEDILAMPLTTGTGKTVRLTD